MNIFNHPIQEEFNFDPNQPYAIFENQLDKTTEIQIDFFSQPIAEVKAEHESQVPQCFHEIETLIQKGYYIVGYTSYEAFGGGLKFPSVKNDGTTLLLHYVAFKKRLRMSSAGFELQILPKLLKNDDPLILSDFKLNETFESYKRKIQKIKQHQKEGDTYQVNFTMKNRFQWQGSAIQFFLELKKYQSVEMAAFFHFDNLHICSYSPELFFYKKGEDIVTKPMKGTAPRGVSLEDDEQIKQEMLKDSKTQAENLMIVDLLRNDLGRIALPGSVKVPKLFEIETYPTLHQMTSTIEAKVSSSLGLFDLMKALFPCGSVTGAPKKSTMKIIAELEEEPRGLYTGALGYLLPVENSQPDEIKFNVAIRTLILEKNKGEMGIGSGIVYDSQTENEWNECLLKSKFVKRLNSSFQLIETFRFDVQTQSFLRLNFHIERLQKSAQSLGFEWDLDLFKTQLEKMKHDLPQVDCRVRFTLSQNGELQFSYLPIQQNINKENAKIFKVICCKKPIKKNSIFQRFKTTNRQFYENRYQKASTLGYDDVLFFNEDSNFVEASRYNILFKFGNELITPPITDGSLPGVFRQTLLLEKSLVWEGKKYSIIEKSVGLNDVFPTGIKDSNSTAEILLCNSVRGIVRAKLLPLWIEDLSHV